MALSFLFSTIVLVPAQSPSASSADEIERRVETILGRMTLEEKIDMLGGVDDFFIRGFPHLGVPRMKMADGPLGVRNYGPATAMAGGIALEAQRTNSDFEITLRRGSGHLHAYVVESASARRGRARCVLFHQSR